MDTPEQPDETTLEAPCPRCGNSVDAIFKFCPHCGLEVRVQIVEAKSDVVETDDIKKLSPDAQQKLVAFEQQFEAMEQKMRTLQPLSRGLTYADSSITKFAIVLGVLILLGVIASWYIISQFISSMSGRTPAY